MSAKTILSILALGLAAMACEEAPAAGSCCQVAADSCASGPTVTAEVCVGELGGTWAAGDCNTETGACE